MDVIIAEITKGLGIFGLAWFSFWTAIPAGLALGLHATIVIVITSTSYISGMLIMLLPAQFVRERFIQRLEAKLYQSTRADSLLMRLWKRYGVVGFSLVAPMTVGAQLGVLIGIALNIPRHKLLIWMTIGVVIWSIGLTLLAVAGVNLIVDG